MNKRHTFLAAALTAALIGTGATVAATSKDSVTAAPPQAGERIDAVVVTEDPLLDGSAAGVSTPTNEPPTASDQTVATRPGPSGDSVGGTVTSPADPVNDSPHTSPSTPSPSTPSPSTPSPSTPATSMPTDPASDGPAPTVEDLLQDFVDDTTLTLIAQDGWNGPRITFQTPQNLLLANLDFSLGTKNADGSLEYGKRGPIAARKSASGEFGQPTGYSELVIHIEVAIGPHSASRIETILVEPIRLFHFRSIELDRAGIGPVADIWHFEGSCWLQVGVGDTGVRKVVDPKVADTGSGGSELCLPPEYLWASLREPATWYISGEFIDAYGRYPVTTTIDIDLDGGVTEATLVGPFSAVITVDIAP